MDMELLKSVIMKHIDLKGLEAELLAVVLMPFLEKFVADTANPYDDKLIMWLKEFMEKKA